MSVVINLLVAVAKMICSFDEVDLFFGFGKLVDGFGVLSYEVYILIQGFLCMIQLLENLLFVHARLF